MNALALILAVITGIFLLLLAPIIFNIIVAVIGISAVVFCVYLMYHVFKDILEKK